MTAVAEPQLPADPHTHDDAVAASVMATTACACTNGGLTAEQQTQINELMTQINDLQRGLAQVEAAQIRVERERDQLDGLIAGLNARLVMREQEAQAAAKAYSDFLKANPHWVDGSQEVLNEGNRLLNKSSYANGRLAELKEIIADYNRKREGMQGHIELLNATAVEIRNHIEDLRNQQAAIRDAARACADHDDLELMCADVRVA